MCVLQGSGAIRGAPAASCDTLSLESAVGEGELRAYAEAARRLGVSRARVAQVLGLLSLSARLQERILSGELVISERRLRPALSELCWKAQEEVVEERSRE